MPTIVINERFDRTDKKVTVTIAETKTGDRKRVYERGKQYVVPHEVLAVLKSSHEGPYVRVLDPHSREPTADELPKPETDEPPPGKLDEAVKAFGKAKDKAASAPA